MQITTMNAAVVAAIFAKLSDARFQMRTVPAITKETAVTEAQVLDVSAEMGLQQLRRIRDNAPLIVRPAEVTPAQSLEIAQRAEALANGAEGAAEFELSFNESTDAGADADEGEPNDDGMQDC